MVAGEGGFLSLARRQESARGLAQSWSLEHLEEEKRAANWRTIGLLVEILRAYPDLYCEVHGTTTAPQGGVADAALAAHFGLHAERQTQAVMDTLARKRAEACRDALVRRGVPAAQLFVSARGCAGQMKVDFFPRTERGHVCGSQAHAFSLGQQPLPPLAAAAAPAPHGRPCRPLPAALSRRPLPPPSPAASSRALLWSE